MMQLFEFPPTRSQRAKWILEELAVPYESYKVDLPGGEQNTESYRARQPLGSVPALQTDDYAMFESIAIVMQLIDEHPETGLAPAPGAPERAAYYQWCVFAGTELDPAIMMHFDNALRPADHMRPPGRKQDIALAGYGREDFATRAEILSAELSGRDYMLTSGFSGADILIGHSCFMAAITGLIGDFPVLEAYLARLGERPAYQRAYAGIDRPF